MRALTFLLAGILLLGGCADMPKPPPCTTWECDKEKERQLLIRQCVKDARNELTEEIMAGFYSGADIRPACEREVAKRFK